MKRIQSILLGSLLAVFIISISTVSFIDSVSAKNDLKQLTQDCTSAITNTSSTVEGYASPVSPSGDLLLSVTGCDEKTISIEAGNGSKDTYIYPTGAVWDGTSWKKFSFKGDSKYKKDGNWIVGSAVAIVNATEDPWISAYVCEKSDSTWSCGTTSNMNHWMLQHVKRTSTVSETWLMGYYDPSGFRTIEPKDLPWQHLTHIALGDTEIATWGGLDVTFDIPNSRIKDVWSYNELNDAVKEANKNNVVPLIKFGGGKELTDEWRALLSEEKIEFTVNDIYGNMEEHDFKGIDINWTDISEDDLVALKDLVERIKKKNADTTVTVALPYLLKDQEANALYTDIAKLADRVNLMNHLDEDDLLDQDESSHYSPLKIENGAPFSIEKTVATYVDAGVTKKKINIEVPYHGQCWDEANGPYAKITRSTSINALVPIEEIITEYPISEGGNRDRFANVSYVEYNDDEGIDNCTFISYVERQDAIDRAEWVRGEDLGGIIVWDLAEETMSNTRNRFYMTEAIYRELGNN